MDMIDGQSGGATKFVPSRNSKIQVDLLKFCRLNLQSIDQHQIVISPELGGVGAKRTLLKPRFVSILVAD